MTLFILVLLDIEYVCEGISHPVIECNKYNTYKNI